MQKLILVLSFLATLHSGALLAANQEISWTSRSKELEDINAELENLEDMKRGYLAKALRAEDLADRLQFEDQFSLEARRYYEIAEENRMKAREIQIRIDQLSQRKATLIRQ